MRHTITTLGFGLVLLILAAAAPVATATDVLHHPDMKTPLNKRWAWAEKQASGNAFPGGVWIGYSIEKMMGKNAFTGCWNSDWQDRISLSEILYNRKIEEPDAGLSKAESIRQAVREALDEIEGNVVGLKKQL